MDLPDWKSFHLISKYNESTILTDALERYRQRNGHYPKRVLVDQIYRTKSNRDFCKENGIEMSGPKLGRPPKDGGKKSSMEEYQDNTDRIEVERFFSRDKQSFGAGLITTKLMGTTLTSIALSVLAANIFETETATFLSFIYVKQLTISVRFIGLILRLHEYQKTAYLAATT